jgi:hypothetical protein
MVDRRELNPVSGHFRPIVPIRSDDAGHPLVFLSIRGNDKPHVAWRTTMRTNAKAGAYALIVGWLAYICLMAVHPSHAGGPSLGHITLNDAVHWTGLLVAPFLAYGYFEMTRLLGFSRPLPVMALSLMVFSLFSGMSAGIMSGLVQAEVARAVSEHESAPEILTALRHMTYWLNQGFAAIHYTLAALGVGLYGLTWMSRPSGRMLGVGGLTIAGVFLAWLATGHWRPDLHGALVVVLAIGAWTITAGLAMRKLADEPD